MPENRKPIIFLGNTRSLIQELDESVRRKMGYALHIVQTGKQPENVKNLSGFQVQVQEVRIRDNSEAYRAVYAVALGDTVYLLHAFHKKSKKGIGIPQRDVNVIRERLKDAMRMEAGKNE